MAARRAMATAFGGAVTVLALSIRPGIDSVRAVLGVAVRYEWLFWAAVGGAVGALFGIIDVALFAIAGLNRRDAEPIV